MTATDQLAAIQARADAATPGPWESDTGTRGDCVVWGPNGRFLMNAQAEPHWLEYPGEKRSVSFDVDARDAEFIAHARTDVPALIAVVRERDAAIERVRELHTMERVEVPLWQSGLKSGGERCGLDGQSWPCETIAALTATEGAE